MFAATPDGEGQWSLEELVIEGSDNGRLNAYVIAFGRDNVGDLYVLTTGGTIGGTVHRIVPPSGKTVSKSVTDTTSTAMTDTTTTDTTTVGGTVETNTVTEGPAIDGPVTGTETTSKNVTNAGGGSTAGSGTDGARTTGTETNETDGSETETTGTSGSGFSALAALSGLASVVAYLLSGDE